jgi:hypothetical protein
MIKAAKTLAIIAAVALASAFVPPLGPMGPCADTGQMIVLLIFLSCSVSAILLLVARGMVGIWKRNRTPRIA